MIDRWRLPGSGEDALTWYYGAESRVLSIKSIDLESAHVRAHAKEEHCAKCHGTGTVGRGVGLTECGKCAGFGVIHRKTRPRVRSLTSRCDRCAGSGQVWAEINGRIRKRCTSRTRRVACLRCSGLGYTENLTVDYSLCALPGAVPEINDVALHQYGAIAHRLGVAGWRAEAVLRVYFGAAGNVHVKTDRDKTGNIDPRLALYAYTDSGRKAIRKMKSDIRSRREGKGKKESDVTGVSWIDSVLFPEYASLKRDADAEVDALLARAFVAWNGAVEAATPRRRANAPIWQTL